MMTLDSVLYVLEIYWPYALAVLAVGIIVGWLSYRPIPQPMPPAPNEKS